MAEARCTYCRSGDFPFEAHFLDLAWLLLERGADVNARDRRGSTPLLLAMEWGSHEIAEFLLEHGARPNVTKIDGKTPLHLVFEGAEYYSEGEEAEILVASVVRSLLDRGADVNAEDRNHTTPLLLAIRRKMYDVARILLERGADPNVKNDKGKTPLHLLLERSIHDHDDINSVLVVERLLLEHGADVNAQDKNKITPLQLASNHQRLEIAQIILGRTDAGQDQVMLYMAL
jgi:ankyrin repeat protein